MKTYVNGTIYNALPEQLRNVITPTNVLSGHECNRWDSNYCAELGSGTYSSLDNLYLLATREVFIDDDSNSNDGIDYYDTSYNSTRQLDYYANLGVSTTNKAGAAKRNNSSESTTSNAWWLRSPEKTHYCDFYYVEHNGNVRYTYTTYPFGVAPAFRIG